MFQRETPYTTTDENGQFEKTVLKDKSRRVRGLGYNTHKVMIRPFTDAPRAMKGPAYSPSKPTEDCRECGHDRVKYEVSHSAGTDYETEEWECAACGLTAERAEQWNEQEKERERQGHERGTRQ